MHNLLQDDAVSCLRKNSRAVVRELGLLGEEYQETGLTLMESHLMIELGSSFFPDVCEVAQLLLIDKSTASRLVAQLVNKKFALYITDERDRRRRCLQLTEKGKKKLESIKSIADEQVQAALAMLKLEDQQLVLMGMSLYAQILKKARLRKEFSIEQIDKQDNMNLAKMIIAVLEEFDCNKPGFASHDAELQDMYATYQKAGHAYFVVKQGKQILGGAGIAPLSGSKEKIGELRKMYLAPQARGMGLGNLLMEKCLAEAKKQEYISCYLETNEYMTYAQNLYLKFGFKKLSKRKGHTGHFGCQCFYERKF